MSIRHISAVMLVAVSVLAVQVLLFAQEGWPMCKPATFNEGGNTFTFPLSGGGGKEVSALVWKNLKADGTCVDESNQDTGCYTFEASPKNYSKLTITILDANDNPVGDPEITINSTGTYTDCLDGC